ncbi:hypothetical protein SteCoe_3493 [Stentor coeruleus]|uniref:E3 ubiquitin protein ligase n=1 Tax=Stentor coeruleus TaxID=5963 RepID=A0A1R2CWY3_9CILI|nr:hypothetical protein SteCoe_3493 [Stentor coeruleus]
MSEEPRKRLKLEDGDIAILPGDYQADCAKLLLEELKSELLKAKEEKKFITSQLEEKNEKLMKIQLEMEVSEERFVRSKAFKSLVSQARTVVKAMEQLKRNNEELQKINDDHIESKNRDLKLITNREEEKRQALVDQIQNLQTRLTNIEKERDESLMNLNILKKEKVHQKTSSNYRFVIEDLEEEKNRLRKQISDCSKEKSDLLLRFEEEQKRSNDLRDALVLKDIELSKVTKEVIQDDLPEPELIQRLKDYRNEVLELKSQLKVKDSTISKNDSIIRQLKQDIKNEKRNNETLINEIDVTGNAYEEIVKKNKLLSSQLAEQEQNCIQLMNERLRENNWKTLMDKQQILLEEQAKAKENVIAHLQEVIKEEKKLSDSRLDSIIALESKFKTLESRLHNISVSQNDNNKRFEELLNCKRELQEKLKEAEKICIKNATECLQYKFLYEHTEKCLRENEDKMAYLKDSMYVKTSDEIYMTEIAKYRDLIRCSQCKTRNKDCLLTKCLHLFCRRCIELNLSQKKRKCPCCFTKFTSEDVRTFYWS